MTTASRDSPGDAPSGELVRRISIVIGTLGGGGAERVALMIAGHWQASGHAVTLITLSDSEPDSYPVPAHVQRVGLHDRAAGSGRLRARLARVRELRRVLTASRPDTIVSLIDITNIFTLLAARRLGVPIIVCEEVDPRAHRIPPVWRALRWLLYRRATRVVVRAKSVQSWAARVARRGCAVVIPNAITIVPAARNQSVTTGGHRAMAMGRLVPQKGFDLLIGAFASIAAAHPDWELVIRGEGPERPTLEALVSHHGLEGQVSLPGFSNRAADEYATADLFVLSSRYEGFALVLLEAMASGLACIAFDCPSGPGELVDDEVNGILVPVGDVSGLGEAMRRLMDAPAERDRLGRAALAIRDQFSQDRVMLQWDALLSDVNDSPAPRTR